MNIATTLARSNTDVPYSGVEKMPTNGMTKIELKPYSQSIKGASRLAPNKKKRIRKRRIELTVHKMKKITFSTRYRT